MVEKMTLYQRVNGFRLSEDESAPLFRLLCVIQVVDLVMVPEFLSPVDSDLSSVDKRSVGATRPRSSPGEPNASAMKPYHQ
jgi:hypothetical protein